MTYDMLNMIEPNSVALLRQFVTLLIFRLLLWLHVDVVVFVNKKMLSK